MGIECAGEWAFVVDADVIIAVGLVVSFARGVTLRLRDFMLSPSMTNSK